MILINLFLNHPIKHGKKSSQDLIQLLLLFKGRTIEASLNNGIFNATHFLNYGGKKIFDCGIDDAPMSWYPQEFLAFYPKSIWGIDQIV